MLIKKSQAKMHQNSNDCTVWEYEFPSQNFSFATALIDGRYPTEKRAVNLECEEVYFVIFGSGIVHSEKGDFVVATGDLYFFEKGERYWVEGNQLKVALANAPKWTPGQYKVIE